MQSVAKCVEILENRGHTRKDIAELLGFEYESLRNLLRGRIKNPNWEVVTKLHKLSGQSLDRALGIDNGLDALLERYRNELSEARKSLARTKLERDMFFELLVELKGSSALENLPAPPADGEPEGWMKDRLEDDQQELLSQLNKDKP